jgi:hypothetical protein
LLRRFEITRELVDDLRSIGQFDNACRRDDHRGDDDDAG